MRRIDRSPYGRALRAIREDAQVAQVAASRVLRFKTEAFVLSAADRRLAGALYGTFTSYIAPDMFLPLITVYIFLAVASGGTGGRRRPGRRLHGHDLARILALLRRMDPGVTAVQRAALKELLIAVALIVVLRLKTSGVLPEARAAGAATFIGAVHDTVRILRCRPEAARPAGGTVQGCSTRRWPRWSATSSSRFSTWRPTASG
jgi:ABC-type branched-subunit amino acid transport system permease subunit